MRTTIFLAAAFLTCMSFFAAASAQSFMGLGDLPGGDFESNAANLSADGRFVTGGSVVGSGFASEAFLWTQSTGMVGLGNIPGTVGSQGNAVSNDGSTVVGLYFQTGLDPARAFQWTSGDGPAAFAPFPAVSEDRSANDLSADGRTVVGSFRPGQSEELIAYHWDSNGLTEIGDGLSFAVSADGSVVVGSLTVQPATSEHPIEINEAFLWTAGGGPVGLGYLPGGSIFSGASGISANGQVVVGGSESTLGTQAFRWTEADGMDGLGDLPGGDFDSLASDTTADGSIVVGRSDVLGGQLTSSNDPFIWDEVHGMRNLVDVLTNDYGLGSALVGWNLTEATAISDDGRVIIGNGINPDGNSEAWRVVLVPEPSAALLCGLASTVCLAATRRRT